MRGLNVVIVVPVLWLFSCVRGPEPESGAEPMSGAVSEAAPIGRGELTAEPGEVVVDASSGPRSTREVQVRLTNAGAGPLTIEQVDTSCSCTIAESLEMRTLEPAESVMLSLQLRPPVYGSKETLVVVRTDSETRPELVIPVQMEGPADTAPYVRTTPSRMTIAGAVPGEEIERRLDVWTTETPGTEPWLTGLASSSDHVSATIVGEPLESAFSSGLAQRRYDVRVTGRIPASDEEIVEATVRFETRTPSAAGHPEQVIPVQVRLRPAVRAVPDRLFIAVGGDTEFPIRRSVMLVGAADEVAWEAAVDRDALPQWLEVDVADSDEPGRVRLKLTVAEAAADALGDDGRLEVQVPLECTHPDCRQVSLGVRVARVE
ncbi:DUF1573 domain-containing protein [Maioricimonas sp. JC845]|uniref:DUF1573 domain-containing protein n=1 Tax=Maioricimonas sp. JC845 TaxID=3232138 RepID=UPI003457922D